MRGAEPIGLLRWSNMTAKSLAEALETEFDGVGSPKETVLDYIKHQDGHLEYATANRRLGMEMHTWVASDQVPYDKMFEDSCKRLTLLRRKLIEDLRGGQKLFVFKMGDKTCNCRKFVEFTQRWNAMDRIPYYTCGCRTPLIQAARLSLSRIG